MPKQVDHVKTYFDNKREEIRNAESISELLHLATLKGNSPGYFAIKQYFKNELNNDLEKCREHATNIVSGMQYKMYN